MHTNLVGYYFNVEQSIDYICLVLLDLPSSRSGPPSLAACQLALLLLQCTHNLLKTHHLSDYIYAGRNGCLDA